MTIIINNNKYELQTKQTFEEFVFFSKRSLEFKECQKKNLKFSVFLCKLSHDDFALEALKKCHLLKIEFAFNFNFKQFFFGSFQTKFTVKI